MATLYPAAVAHLRVRLDEPAADSRSLLASLLAQASCAGETVNADGPLSIAAPSPGDPFAWVLSVPLRRCTVRRTGFMAPDEASIEVDSSFLPIDPRVVRALAVDIYIGSLTPDEYEAMITGSGPPESLAVEGNQRFIGYADQGDWELHDGVFRADLRGLQSLLEDSLVRKAVVKDLDIGRRLHDVVYDLIQCGPMTRGMRVVIRGVDNFADVPRLKDTLPRTFRRVKGGRWRLPTQDAGESFWSIIVRLCHLSGWVPSVELDRVVLRPGESLYTGLRRNNNRTQTVLPGYRSEPAPDGFERQVGGEILRAPRMVWGDNLESLRFTRPWGEIARRPIRAIAYVPGTGKTLTSDYPPDKKTAAKVGASGKVATEERMIFHARGVTSQAQLDNVARSIHRQRAINELQGGFSTREFFSFGGSGTDDELLGLKGGATVEIRIATNLEGGSHAELIEGLSRDELVAALVNDSHISADVAEEWADASKGRSLPTYFRVREASHTYDSTAGYSLNVEFHNYLDAGVIEAEAVDG